VRVTHTGDLKNEYPDASIIISAAGIHDMIENLNRIGYPKDNLFPALPFLKGYDLNRYFGFQKYNEQDSMEGFVKFAVDCTIACQDGFGSPEKVFMRSVDIVVTEKCSMKCADCSNLMQYFNSPINYEIDDMKEAIDLLSEYADEIHEFRVIGGEPFMNKNWHIVLDSLTSKENVKRVVIYTNGTILPREHQIASLKNEKIIFMITDYSGCGGDDSLNKKTANLSRSKKRVDKLEELCQKEEIDYRRHPPENWTDCGRIEDFNRSDEENKEVFRSCCCKNLITLSEGELHRCPFSAQITRLGVSDFKEDYIELAEEISSVKMKKKLRSFLFEKDSLSACKYCPGRKLSDEQIIPAVQTEKPIPIPVSLLPRRG
jgi:organic radical activating enzyme